MREDLLHFVWKYKKIQQKKLTTAKGDILDIVAVGTHNKFAGPDFFNAQVRIDNQLWAGNVEIHVKSSDWYAHGHETDENYNNVILHVVWEDDVTVFRSDNSQIPTLVLNKYISETLLSDYNDLFTNRINKFIHCDNQVKTVDSFLIENWIERLYFERLERKSVLVSNLLQDTKNNWEQTLFVLLLKSFGSKINGASFLSLGKSLDFAVARKVQKNGFQFESLLYGMLGLLESQEITDSYFLGLKKEFAYLSSKFDLASEGIEKPHFFKLRPPNFPTIRLSQLVQVYTKNQNLFSTIIEAKTLEDLYSVFDVAASLYWNTHYTFGKTSKHRIKTLTKKFVDLLVINTILPLKFSYAKYLGKEINEELIGILLALKNEENTIVSNFSTLGVLSKNAMESQGVIELYNEYCSKNKCLECSIGTHLLSQNNYL